MNEDFEHHGCFEFTMGDFFGWIGDVEYYDKYDTVEEVIVYSECFVPKGCTRCYLDLIKLVPLLPNLRTITFESMYGTVRLDKKVT